MRPLGEVSEVLLRTLCERSCERGPMTARELAVAAQVGFEVARRTLDNLVRAGHVAHAGFNMPPGTSRWQARYAPIDAAADHAEALASVVYSWPRYARCGLARGA